ncbi:ABC transporter permease [Methanoculleus bourgensis]|uniref:ABC transporter permease n=1 Tax=Methanoculleus bourgensis TaxID=83986 RepID=UPI0022EEC4EA|nr:ABC transporter permease [Methanoculleus bourgensis]GLI46095.1 ABC transporter substrate-binding protein [Methanoculleus bourgensis]
MIFADIYMDLAKRNVRLHFLRSLLAVIGIVIGVFAITSMGILGSALQVAVTSDLAEQGGQLQVYPSSESGIFGTSSEKKLITEQQLSKIEKASGNNPVIPFRSSFVRYSAKGKENFASVYSLAPNDIPQVMELEEGVMIRGGSRALISSSIANEYDLRVGSRIKVGDEGHEKSILVAGILKDTGFGSGISTYNSIIVTDRLYDELEGKANGYDQVLVMVRDIDKIDDVKESIEKNLNGRKKTVEIMDLRGLIESINSIIGTVSLVVTGIAGISLVVAAVSIFNVMMMSVNERIREIGILKSIGVKRGEISRMFLYEAAILGFIGSLIGGILSLLGGGVLILLVLQDISFLFAPPALLNVVWGMAVGTGVCVLSGVYPARKASKLSPIVALAAE